MNENITVLYQSWYKMLNSLTDEERHNWYKLMFTEDPECHILGTELFNSFENTNFDYLLIMNQLISYRYA